MTLKVYYCLNTGDILMNCLNDFEGAIEIYKKLI